MNVTSVCILNVDDYLPGRYARTKILQQAGFTVLEAGTGEETLRLVAEHRPSLILLDVNLPDMSGFEICRKIKEDPELSPTTVIHISASSVQNFHLVDGLEAGADAYLVEPVDASVLVATVKAFLRARRAESALRRSNEELEWFAHRAAHDLNEPLRAIVVYTQLLEMDLKDQLSTSSQRSIQFVLEAGQRMRDLIDRLLRYAQVARGGDRPPIDCEAILARVCANLEAAISKSGAVVTHSPLPTCEADPEIEEVLQNLIANAIKYAREGIAPEIHVSASAEPGGWKFAIRDNGVGIDPAYRDSIFQIFRRLHGSDIPGTGIGLAIAKKIVVSQGGTIWVESTHGAGSTFYFTLPRERSVAPRIPTQ